MKPIVRLGPALCPPPRLGARIRLMRRACDLTQAQLGIELDLIRHCVNGLENDRSSPSLETIVRLATRFHVDLHWLVLGEPRLSIFRLQIEPRPVPTIERCGTCQTGFSSGES